MAGSSQEVTFKLTVDLGDFTSKLAEVQSGVGQTTQSIAGSFGSIGSSIKDPVSQAVRETAQSFTGLSSASSKSAQTVIDAWGIVGKAMAKPAVEAAQKAAQEISAAWKTLGSASDKVFA